VKYVVEYGPASSREAAQTHFPAHRARYAEFVDEGTLLMIGTFTDMSGAIGVFTSREAAEEFVKDDPFVLEGVVTSHTIREWNEVLSES
jgi:hypothetical protein